MISTANLLTGAKYLAFYLTDINNHERHKNPVTRQENYQY